MLASLIGSNPVMYMRWGRMTPCISRLSLPRRGQQMGGSISKFEMTHEQQLVVPFHDHVQDSIWEAGVDHLE